MDLKMSFSSWDIYKKLVFTDFDFEKPFDQIFKGVIW